MAEAQAGAAGADSELRELLALALARIDDLAAEVAELRGDVAAPQGAVLERGPTSEVTAGSPTDRTAAHLPSVLPDDGRTEQHPPPDGIDRRRALKGAAVAAGVAAAGLILGDARPAAAADGSALVLGSQAQGCTQSTAFAVTGSTKRVGLGVVDNSRASYASNPALSGHAKGSSFDVAVEAKAEGSSRAFEANSANGNALYAGSSGDVAVMAVSNGSHGVYGYSSAATGNGVLGEGAANAGVRGISVNFRGVIGDSTGNDGVHGVTHSNLSSVSGVLGTSTTGVATGVTGQAATGTGVYGSSTSGHGVHGASSSGSGIYGESTNFFGGEAYSTNATGFKARGKVYGVIAQSLATNPDHAALAASATGGMGIAITTETGRAMAAQSLSGGGVEVIAPMFHLRLTNNDTRVAPTADTFAHAAGDIVHATGGDTWVCVTEGTPGKWRKLAGPTAAGSFHVLPAPVRIYDSRAGTAPSQGPKTRLTGNVARTLDCTVNNSGVPKGATAVALTVLLVNAANGNGNLTIWANGVARPAATTAVWGAGSGRYTSSTISSVDANAKIQASASADTDLVLDVVGYYR